LKDDHSLVEIKGFRALVKVDAMVEWGSQPETRTMYVLVKNLMACEVHGKKNKQNAHR
jgi:hypothetical protein